MKSKEEIEKAILSAVMTYNAAHLIYFLEPEDFSESNRAILNASLELLHQGKPVTLISILNRSDVDRMRVVSCLDDSYYDAVYISQLALEIKQKNIENKFGKFLRELYDEERDDGYRANLRDFMHMIGNNDIFDLIHACGLFFENKKAVHLADKIKSYERSMDSNLKKLSRQFTISMLKQKINELNG